MSISLVSDANKNTLANLAALPEVVALAGVLMCEDRLEEKDRLEESGVLGVDIGKRLEELDNALSRVNTAIRADSSLQGEASELALHKYIQDTFRGPGLIRNTMDVPLPRNTHFRDSSTHAGLDLDMAQITVDNQPLTWQAVSSRKGGIGITETPIVNPKTTPKRVDSWVWT